MANEQPYSSSSAVGMADNIEGSRIFFSNHFRQQIAVEVMGEAARFWPWLRGAEPKQIRRDDLVISREPDGHLGPLSVRTSARVQQKYRVSLPPGLVEGAYTFEEECSHRQSPH